MNGVTQLLREMALQTGGQRKETFDQLFPIVLTDLRRRARQQMKGEHGASLQPTILINESYRSLLNYRMSFENHEHFLNVAGAAMRRIVIDRARKMRSAKRGSGDVAASLSGIDVAGVLNKNPEILVDLDRALADLTPAQVQLVELRFFAGFTLEETAKLMKLNVETAKKRWEVIRIILFSKLNPPRSEPSNSSVSVGVEVVPAGRNRRS